jgi:hydrogenase/urease accessory protein HupE
MSRRLWRTWMALVSSLVLAFAAGPSAAHEMSMAELELRQMAPNDYLWQWTAGNRSGENTLQPEWPAGCNNDDGVLRCGEGGFKGRLGMAGVGDKFSAVLVKVQWADGRNSVFTLTAGQPSVQVYGGADDERGMGEIVRAYTILGVEHILSGFDHLLFVIGLLFLVGFQRRLVWTISAFTLAHSLTLASAALGWLTLRAPPVEACIALSIVLVAYEALNKEPTLSRRLPALVAFGFGLVHGLGFAGVLQEIGLPQQHLLAALLAFNLGVEIGQLLVVGAAGVLVLLLRNQPWAARLRVPALYGIGSLAAFWTWTRVALIVG